MCSLLSHLIGIGSQHHTYSKARAKNGTNPKLSVIYDIMSVSCVFADTTGIYLSKNYLIFGCQSGFSSRYAITLLSSSSMSSGLSLSISLTLSSPCPSLVSP